MTQESSEAERMEEFGIEISDEEIDNLHSVADVLAVIKNKI